MAKEDKNREVLYQIALTILGVLGSTLINEPILLSFSLYALVIILTRKFTLIFKEYGISRNLMLAGLFIPFLFGVYSFRIPDLLRLTFLVFTIPVFSFVAFSLNLFLANLMNRAIKTKIPFEVKEILDALTVVFSIMTFLAFVLSLLLYNSDVLGFYSSIFSALSPSLNTIVSSAVVVSLLVSFGVYYALRRKVKIKLCNAQLFTVIFVIILLTSTVYLLSPFATYPAFYGTIGIAFQNIADENFYFCRGVNDYQLVYNNIFKSNICEIAAFNQTGRQYHKILLPDENGKENLPFSMYSQNLTVYSLRCGVLVYNNHMILNC